MADESTPRPSKVTSACLMAGAAAVLVLIQVVATLSDWGSLEVREQVESALGTAPVDVSVEVALRWLRVVLMVAGALSAAAIVLAIWTAKRHRGARIGLTVVAALETLAFAAAGLAGLLPALLGVLVIAFLWSREARAWFRPPAAAAAGGADPFGQTPPSARSTAPPATPGPDASRRPSPAAAPRDRVGVGVRPAEEGEEVPPASPRPYASGPGQALPTAPEQPPTPQPAPYGQQPGPYGQQPAAQQPAPYGQQPAPYGQPYGHAAQPLRPVGRPRPLVVAVAIAAGLSALVGGVFALNALVYLASPTEYARLIAEQPMIVEERMLEQVSMSATEFAQLLFWMSLALGTLALAGLGTALWTLSGQPVARIAFTAVTGLAIVVSALAFPFGLVFVAAEAACLVMVWRREVSAWFRSRRP